MKRIIIITIALALIATSAFAGNWTIDNTHSHIGFKVSHMVISKVKGNFDDFSGTIEFDEKDFSKASVDITIKVASIDTDNKDRDEHLRNSDFFAADSLPYITFKSTKIVGKGNEFKIHGDLTLKGITKSVILDAEYNGTVKDPWGNTKSGFSATTTINRQDFNMTWSKSLDAGGLVVGNEIEITLEIEAQLEK